MAFWQRGKSLYTIVTGDWESAQSQSVALGGSLVTINDAAENNWIVTNIPIGVYGSWIGFTDKDFEFDFLWASGQPITFTNWEPGEPNDIGNEDYAAIYPGHGRWNDFNLLTPLVREGIAEINLADSYLEISSVDAVKAEGNSSSTTFTFAITRTGETRGRSSVSWSVTGNSSSPADSSDFISTILPSGTVLFDFGETSKTVSVDVAGDILNEPTESFQVSLSNPIDAIIKTGLGSTNGIILNDDWQQTLTFDVLPDYNSPVRDYDDKGFRISNLSLGLIGPFTFGMIGPKAWPTLTTLTQINGHPFTLRSMRVSEANEAISPLTIQYTGYTADDRSIPFTYTTRPEFTPELVSFPGFTDVVRVDMFGLDAFDDIVAIPSTMYSVIPLVSDQPEGDSGLTQYTFLVSRSPDASAIGSVSWSLAGSGTNPAGADDFSGGFLPSGTLNFLPGETTKTISINIIGDIQGEHEETFKLSLHSPIGGLLDPGLSSTNGVIRNDDNLIAPTITSATIVGRHLQLQFSEPLVTTGLAASRFRASVDGLARSITSFALVPGDLTRLNLRISGAIPTSTQSLTLSYRDLPANNLTGVIQDINGNDMASVAGLSVDTFLSASNVTTLASTYSNLILSGIAVTGVGNNGDNRIIANQTIAINNVLTGGEGVDTIDGGNGSDIYIIDRASHHISAEFHDSGSSGTDEIRFASTIDDDTLVLYSGDTGIERVVIGTGTEAIAVSSGISELNVNAQSAPNALSILGNFGSNILVGTNFSDTINGSRGNDILIGGPGADIFRFSSTLNSLTNRDVLTDFSPAQEDRIELENKFFKALSTTGNLAPSAFVVGISATSAEHRIIYNNFTGALTYDSNGNGVGGEVRFAVLPIGLGGEISSDSFVVT